MSNLEVHKHILEDETVVEHNHIVENKPGHTHSHTQTKAVLNRIAKAIGHLEAISHMIEDGRDCSEVLIQLAAVRSAINNTGKVILQDHIDNCIVEAVEQGNKESLVKLNKAIEMFVK